MTKKAKPVKAKPNDTASASPHKRTESPSKQDAPTESREARPNSWTRLREYCSQNPKAAIFLAAVFVAISPVVSIYVCVLVGTFWLGLTVLMLIQGVLFVPATLGLIFNIFTIESVAILISVSFLIIYGLCKMTLGLIINPNALKLLLTRDQKTNRRPFYRS